MLAARSVYFTDSAVTLLSYTFGDASLQITKELEKGPRVPGGCQHHHDWGACIYTKKSQQSQYRQQVDSSDLSALLGACEICLGAVPKRKLPCIRKIQAGHTNNEGLEPCVRYRVAERWDCSAWRRFRRLDEEDLIWWYKRVEAARAEDIATVPSGALLGWFHRQLSSSKPHSHLPSLKEQGGENKMKKG